MTPHAAALTDASWRKIHPVPPPLQLETVGPWCPLNRIYLVIRGSRWHCTVCLASWDYFGESGLWPADPAASRRPSPAPMLVLAGLSGCAAAALALVAMVNRLDQRLLWWLIAGVAAAGVLYLAVCWGSRQVAAWPYRHNRLGAIYGHDRQLEAGLARVGDPR